MKMRMLKRPFVDRLTSSHLSWFSSQRYRGQGARRLVAVGAADPIHDLIRVDGTDNDKETIVRGVTIPVVSEQIAAGQLIENIPIADNGVTVRAFRVSSLKQSPAGSARWVVVAHLHFPSDDIQFTGQFIFGQGGVLHDVAQHLGGNLRAGVGDSDMIHRAVKRRVGVHMTASVLNSVINLNTGAVTRAFKQHMFENMGNPCAQPFAFVNATSPTPSLDRNDRRRVIRLNDDFQPVR